MANWSVSLDKPVTVEPPNAVAYVSYASDDGRRINSVRVPYAAEVDLLNFLGRECARLSALDVRNDQMARVVATATVAPGPVTLPDISPQQAVADAQNALNQQINAALAKKMLNDALAIDPTIATAQAALDSAQATASTAQVAVSAKTG